jgi:hypothetical protein
MERARTSERERERQRENRGAALLYVQAKDARLATGEEA